MCLGLKRRSAFADKETVKAVIIRELCTSSQLLG